MKKKKTNNNEQWGCCAFQKKKKKTLKLNHRLHEQALHLGDIVKNRHSRGTRQETRKRGARERKDPLSRGSLCSPK